METIVTFAMELKPRFGVLFLENARRFLLELNEKPRTKVLYNLEKTRFLNDPRLFKKLNEEIWEFRTKFNGMQYRLLAFWDNQSRSGTWVIATHGFVKKTDKVPGNEVVRAEQLRKLYFTQKAMEK